MSDIFSPIISKLIGYGFFNLLTFILAMVLVYALLRQRKIFGESPLINGLISFSIAFFIFAYPVISGISLTLPLTSFFAQAFIFMLLFFIGFLIASFFYPNLAEVLKDFFRSRNTLFAIIGLSLVLFVSSGLIGVIYTTSFKTPGAPSAPPENVLLIIGLIIAIVVLLFAASIGRGE
jgi:hypothetical protein